MDFAGKLLVIYNDILKQASPDKARSLVTGLVDDIMWQIQRDGKEITELELHSHLDEVYEVAKSNLDKDVA